MLTRLKTALKLLPDEPSAHLGRARALAVPGRNAEAAQRGIDQNLDTYKLAEKAQNSFRRRRASAADSVGWAYFTKVVASHSCARALAGHFRNLTDDMLKALAKQGGVIGINFAPAFLNSAWGQKQAEIQNEVAARYGIADPNAGWDKVDAATRKKALEEFSARMALAGKIVGEVSIKTAADHIDHVVKVTGNADHVGLGSDFDGIGVAPKGLDNIARIPALTDELKARGYKDADIRKILGGNFQRVFAAVAAGKAR